MKDLYDKHADVYEAMYSHFMNYPREVAFYHKILRKYKCKSLLEIGCGTGNFAGAVGIPDVDNIDVYTIDIGKNYDRLIRNRSDS